MKVKNKETSEIRPAETRDDGIYLYDKITEQWHKYDFDLLAKGWEVYTEPIEYWYITHNVEIHCADARCNWERERSIGNLFETKEEAEKAVERLRAWKRLNDAGLKFKERKVKYDDKIFYRITAEVECAVVKNDAVAFEFKDDLKDLRIALDMPMEEAPTSGMASSKQGNI